MFAAIYIHTFYMFYKIYIFYLTIQGCFLGGNAEDRGVLELKGTDAVMDGRKRP